MKISIFLKMMWVSWQMQKWEVQIIFASSFWFFTFIQNPRKPNVVLHNPIWDLRKYQPLKWEGCCGLGDEQLHRPSPETNSKFSPENQWLEDNMSFWGVSGLFSRGKLAVSFRECEVVIKIEVNTWVASCFGVWASAISGAERRRSFFFGHQKFGEKNQREPLFNDSVTQKWRRILGRCFCIMFFISVPRYNGCTYKSHTIIMCTIIIVQVVGSIY